MKFRYFGIFVLISALLLVQSAAFAGPDPIQLLKDMEKVMRGNSHEMTVSMEIKSSSFIRDYEFKIWMKGTDKAFARVLKPAKVEGQGYLRLESRLWNYLPS